MTCPLSSVTRLDLQVRRGDVFTVAAEIPGDVPLDGFLFTGQIRRKVGAPVVLETIYVTVAPGRWLTLYLSAEQTQGLAAGRYVYDIKALTPGSEYVCTVMEGAVLVRAGVTDLTPTPDPDWVTLARTALQPGQAATPDQGALADTALQPGEAATPAQGALADTALQPGDESSRIGFTPSGTGSVARTVEQRLRDRRSVFDFGAVGDGVADDTDALQAYIDAASGLIEIPAGTFKTTTTLTVAKDINVRMVGQIVAHFDAAPCVLFTVANNRKEHVWNLKKNIQSDWTDDECAGVRYNTLANCNVVVYACDNFTNGLLFKYEAALATAWTKFDIRWMNNNRAGVKIHLIHASAWWNENMFVAPMVRTDSNVNVGQTFYFVHAEAEQFNSFNRNLMYYPAFEGSRCVGLYAKNAPYWVIVSPRLEHAACAQYVNVRDTFGGARNRNLLTDLDGVTFEFDADLTTYALSTYTFPFHAKLKNPTPIFTLQDVTWDATAHTAYPMVSWLVDLAAKTFAYNPDFDATSYAPQFFPNLTRAGNLFSWTYNAAGVRVGVLIERNDAEFLTLEADTGVFVVFLDADKKPLTHQSSVRITDDWIAYWGDVINGYGARLLSSNQEFLSLYFRTDAVKYIMLGVAPTATGTFRRFNVFSSSSATKLVVS